jgi:ribokinase
VAAARQGAKVGVIARIGDDDFGRMALQLWANEGIATEHAEVAANERSGVAQILVFDDGDNSIAVATGAGAGLGEANVDKASEAIRACKVVMASNEVPQVATIAAFKMGRAVNVKTILNPAPATLLPDELLALCDVLTPNETEVRVLAGLPADAGIADAAKVLLMKGAGAVIVTLGSKGCALWQKGQSPQTLAGWAMQVIDTIGAGDTFTGALAAALARGESLVAAMACANAAAALSVTGRGAIAAMPTLAQSQKLKNSYI